MTETMMTCQCGSTSFEDGFIDDAVNGRVRWFSGPMQTGLFGNARRSGPKRTVLAWMCTTCSRLQLFAGPE